MSTPGHPPSGPPDDLRRRVYRQARREFGAAVAPITLHAPVPEVLAGLWCVLRETLLVGQVPRPVKEAVAVAVSRANRCAYCADAHALMRKATAVQAAGIGPARPPAPAEPGLADLLAWAGASGRRDEVAPIALRFDPVQAAELIGTVALFHYINRMVSVLLDDGPLPAPGIARALAAPAAIAWFRRAGARHKTPGTSLPLLPAPPLPGHLAWAQPAPHVAGAFARFDAAVTRAGEQHLAPELRHPVAERIDAWHGENLGPSRAWSHDTLAELSPEHRALGELTLCAALSPHQIEPRQVTSLRAQLGAPALIAALAWASYRPARRIAGWLAAGQRPQAPTGQIDQSGRGA